MALTARLVWEGMLTELSKANAPSLLLHEFNYYFNKAINQYINKRYNIYDISQQTTDDLRVLKATTILTPTEVLTGSTPYSGFEGLAAGEAKLFGATYEVNLPDDYLHMLNCVCIYKMAKNHKCYNKGDYVDFAARRLTADSWSVIINDYYNRPLPERPYYYIHNVNNNLENELTPTNSETDITKPFGKHQLERTYWLGDTLVYIKDGTFYTDPECTIKSVNQDPTNTAISESYLTESNFPREINLSNLWKGLDKTADAVERNAGQRYGNVSKVRCEIRYGRDNSIYQLEKVFIDYIKAPLTIRLTKEQVDLTEDTSQIMEFPDYVCQEIINELTTLIMARDADQRLTVQNAVTLSIANPAQQLAAQQPLSQPKLSAG